MTNGFGGTGTPHATARPRTSEHGQVAGAETLLLGVLVLVVGTLVIANAWAVVDAKLAVTAASREAARTLAEPAGSPGALDDTRDAARQSMQAHGRSLSTGGFAISAIDGGLHRCARFVVTVTHQIAGLDLPWIGGIGTHEVRSSHAEIVDPYRSGISGPVDCGD